MIKSKSKIRFSILLMLAVFIIGCSSIINVNTASALGGTAWNGRLWKWSGSGTQYYSQSYFNPSFDYSMENRGYYPAVVPTSNLLRTGSDAIPAYVDTVDELVALLKSLNRTGGSSTSAQWKRSGSAFVVHSMLGRTGNQANDNGGRSISDADFENLRNRLNSASITWNAVASTDGVNTEASYNSSGIDVQAYRHTKSDLAIIITDGNNHNYKIFRHCANPVGSVDGIADVPKDYNLTPSVTVDHKAGEPGESVKVTPSISNSGRAKSTSTYWSVSSMAFAPTATIPSTISLDQKTAGADRPCDYYKSKGAQDCTNASSGTGSFSTGSPSSYTGSSGASFSTKDLIIGDYEAGTKVCYGLSVFSRNEKTGSDQTWAHSVPICLVVGKKPKVQVWGGDLIVGRSFSTDDSTIPSKVMTSTSTKTLDGVSRTFGSWVEYGIFATGTISGAASKSAFAGPGMENAKVCDYNILTFSNSNGQFCIDNDAKLGNYQTSQSIPGVLGNFPQAGNSITQSSLNPNSLLASKGLYVGTRDGSLQLNSGVLASGKSIIIKVSGTVTIAGNLTYDIDNGGTGYKNISELPQLVIIANKIVINSGVTRVDAWLVADGTDGIIETCKTGSSSFDLSGSDRLTIDKCDKKLTVNGPVMAKQLWLRRTAGSGIDDKSGNPAEVFNLRADAYLWAAARSIDLGRAQTVYSAELPPRF